MIRTLTGHSDWVNTVAISSDSKYVVSGSSDKTIKIWELSTGDVIRTLYGHSNWVNAVAISSDGKYLVSGSSDDIIKIWEFATAKEIVAFTGEGSINCCAITPDNATIIAGDASGNVHFLRLEGMEVQS